MLQTENEQVLSPKKPIFGFLRRRLAPKDCNGRAQVKNTKKERAVIKVIFSDDSLSRLARIINKGEQVQSFEANISGIQYLNRHRILFCADELFLGEYPVRITYRDGAKSVETLKRVVRVFLNTGEEFDISFRVAGMTLSAKAVLVRQES